MSDRPPASNDDPARAPVAADDPAPHLQEDAMSSTLPVPPLAPADWDTEVLPGRPRHRLLTPLTAALAAALVGAAGFIVGVEVEKNQLPAGSSAAAGRRASGVLATIAGTSGRSGASAGTAGAAGAAGGAGGAGASATVGQVANVAGPDLYVTDQQGNTIKVVTSAASQITRQVSATVRGVQPGDTVVVGGPKAADGSVQATSVRDSGAGGAAGLGTVGGGGGRRGAGAGAAGGASGGASSAATSGGAAGGATGAAAGGGAPALFGP
jgi:hypothetical protein